MTLANYIDDLLYRYDCVIVPDFGGFVTNNVGAKIDENNHVFYPPTKQVSFNSYLKHNDGLLANYVASVEKISFDEANEKIASEILEWNEELKTNKIAISSVGSLVKNSTGQLVFEPENQTNFLTDSFGLSAVEFTEIANLKEEGKILNPNFVAPQLDEVKDVEVRVENATNKEVKKGIPAFIKYAATAAILLTLTAVGYNKLTENNQLMTVNDQEEVSKKIQQATFVIDNPLPTINLTIKKEATKKYHVIAGAFQNEINATNKVNQLKNKGYAPEILGKNKWGLIQVSFKSFSKEEAARNFLADIKKQESSEAWLFIK